MHVSSHRYRYRTSSVTTNMHLIHERYFLYRFRVHAGPLHWELPLRAHHA